MAGHSVAPRGAGPTLGLPLSAISRSNWSPESAESEARCSKRVTRMVLRSARNWIAVKNPTSTKKENHRTTGGDRRIGLSSASSSANDRVHACNGGGSSGYSNVASATTLLNPTSTPRQLPETAKLHGKVAPRDQRNTDVAYDQKKRIVEKKEEKKVLTATLQIIIL